MTTGREKGVGGRGDDRKGERGGGFGVLHHQGFGVLHQLCPLPFWITVRWAFSS